MTSLTLTRGGAASDLLARFDWSASPMGLPARWPAAFRIGLDLIMNSAESMYLAWGPDRLFFFNDAYAPLLGPRVATAMGQPFAQVWADVWDQVHTSFDAVFLGGSERFVDMPLAMARRGVPEQTWWTYSFSPFRDETGAVAALLCVTNEQTGRIAREANERDERVDLREELARTEEQLRQAQKIEAIGQLTGGVAHDFNNFLTVIRGSIDLLRRPNLADDRRRRYIDAIAETAERAGKLTSQLLAFARRQALKPEIFDVGASLIDLSAIIRTLAGSAVTVVVRVPDDDVIALADRGQFDTAIVNMAINGRDAMTGGGQLTISVTAVDTIPAGLAHLASSGDFVAVTITDTGTGIAADQQAQIFEPFFTTKPVGQGTGLGLSQVFGFAKQSGGELRVDSVPGQGATFTLYLPRVAGQPDAAAAALPDADLSGDGLCVLVVEDNQSVGDFAVDALRTLGYDSILTRDGAQALAELGADPARFDVVFSDVVMPEIDGLELARRIRTLHPGLPVVLASGYSHVLAQTGRRDFDLLHKPYSIDQLSRALHKAIARARL